MIMINDTAYQKRIQSCFRQAYNFLDTHKHPSSCEDWEKIMSDLNQFNKSEDILLKGLLLSVLEELEINYMKRGEAI